MITSHYPNVSINTGNPSTEMARRDALRRDLFEPIKETEQSSAEKPIFSDDKTRQSQQAYAQPNLYDANGKETETRQAVSGRDSDQEEGSGQQQRQQDDEQQKQQQQEQKQLEQLKSRDTEVRQHEQAHSAVGGRYAGAPSYSYEQGPDGKQYAVAGEVQIDVAAVAGDPQATIQKMEQVKAAALAPAEPSAADKSIAATATQTIVQARAELTTQASAANAENSDTSASATANSEADTDEQDTAAFNPLMQQRSQVIAGFYAKATEPQQRHSLQFV